MKYNDLVWGEIDISEKVILQLIGSKELQRLKGIDQGGYSKPFFPGQPRNRFDHSLGVFVLLKKFDAPLAEQIAGLIHDVSHTAFSHAVDYALEDGSPSEQNYQDKIFQKFVINSEIGRILLEGKVNLDYILKEENFPLLERKLPDICADRLDYSLRDGFCAGFIDRSFVESVLSSLRTKDGFWYFRDFLSAKNFSKFFLKMNRLFYAGFPSALMFQTVGDCLKRAYNMGYILKEDFYMTDDEVLRKIKRNLMKDKKLSILWERMNNKIKAKNNPNDYDVRTVCKSRIIDPFCWSKEGLKRVSDVEPGWKKIVKAEMTPKEYFIKFER